MSLSRRAFHRALLGGTFAASRALALPPRPKLMVLVLAEQFRTDYFDNPASTFSPAGFQRLLSTGAYFPNCYHQSVTFTSTGLANIATGTYPSTHGIVADRWFDRASPAHSILSAQSDLLQATTFPSRLLAADPRNRVFGIGADSRVTRLLTGLTPYTPANTQSLAPDPSSKTVWTALDASQPLRAPLRTIDPADPTTFNTLWQSSPASQSAQFQFARDLISSNRLGKSDGIDLLCIVLGSLGALGNEAGANSPLIADLVTRLDREIESFLKFLDDSFSDTAYQLAFTAAHGVADASPTHISAQAIASALPKTCDLEAYVYPYLYLRSGNPLEAVQSLPQVAAWYTASGACSHSGLIRRRLQNSFHPRRSGDAVLAYAPGVSEDFSSGRGVSYGSIYNDDARVPLILFGPQFRAAEIEDNVESIDIAPTLCRALGTSLPSTASGKVLAKAFGNGRA